MSKNMSGSIPVKGPVILPASAIKDIVDSRGLTNSRHILSEKYGISKARVDRVWKEYYGGSTLADYKTGLKKELPVNPVNMNEVAIRHYKTARATYAVKEPKVIGESADAKAKSIRQHPAVKKQQISATKDLDLDHPEAMGDNEAQIMAGEVQAGNNSNELLAAMAEMLEHNQNISDRAVSALERALKIADRRRGRSASRNSDYSTEADYDTTDIDDDSTAVYAKETAPSHEHTSSRRASNNISANRSDEVGGDAWQDRIQYRSAVPLPEESMERPMGVSQMGQRLWERPAGLGTRAQPVYRAERDGFVDGPVTQQGNPRAISGYESTVPAAQYYPSQRVVQSYHGGDYSQRDPQSGQGVGLSSDGRAGLSDTVPGIPWLKKRQ